ncbi:MAG: hypothetical protein ABR910_05140 [Acidobacteriaceae bacterium]|jgi:hypothetical protein
MTGCRLISVLILAAGAAIPAVAANARAPISVAQVAGAISNVGIAISPEQVTLLADVVATTSSPKLTVESMERWGDHRMKVRMNCADAECLPFFVAIQWGQTEPVPAAFAARTATKPAPVKTDSGAIVVRAGAPAILMLEGDHIHIQLPVICLESGSVGQTIRVATQDRRQTFMAEVGDESALKGMTR